MQASLRNTVSEMRSASRQLEESVRQIGSMASGLVAGATQQDELTRDTAAKLDLLSASVGKVTDRARDIDLHVAASLQQKSGANESLSHMIGEISAVESAVGEQGRGFAIVADEVRKLAEKSASAAAQINQVTQTLNNRLGEVEGAIRRGQTSLSSSQDHLEAVALAIGESNQTVQQTSAHTEQIIASAGEQETVRAEIAQHIDSIAHMGSANAAALERAAAAMRDLETLAARLDQIAVRFEMR
jgi:methyl-accepting chemotaxis protein